MSSMLVWKDEATKVEVHWNKDAPFTVVAPIGVWERSIRHYPTQDKAIAAAKRKARQIRNAAPKRLSKLIGPL